jgi:predicted component of type VI protein secretion system
MLSLANRTFAGIEPRPGRPRVALVTVVDTVSDRVFRETFVAGPVRIGGHRANDLRLSHSRVARWHGEIDFEADQVSFRHRAWTRRSSVDGRALARGEAVRLTEQSVIAIGPFRLDVSLCAPRVQRTGARARKLTPLVAPRFSVADFAEPYAAVEVSPCPQAPAAHPRAITQAYRSRAG